MESGWFREVASYSRLANHEVFVDIREGSEVNPFGPVSLFFLGLIPATSRHEVRIRLHIESSERASSTCESSGEFRIVLWTLALPLQLTHSGSKVEGKLLRRLVHQCLDELAGELRWETADPR